MRGSISGYLEGTGWDRWWPFEEGGYPMVPVEC